MKDRGLTLITGEEKEQSKGENMAITPLAFQVGNVCVTHVKTEIKPLIH